MSTSCHVCQRSQSVSAELGTSAGSEATPRRSVQPPERRVGRLLTWARPAPPQNLAAAGTDSRLRTAFKNTYFQHYRVGSDQHRVNRGAYEKAERWYQIEIEMEMGILATGDHAAKARVLKLLGLAGGS